MSNRVEYEFLLPDVEKPARYIGDEVNMVVKNPDDVLIRFCMAFPDSYEVSMSNLGTRIIYGFTNAREDSYCERAFAPWFDMEEKMREHNIPLFSLETASPLADFDIVGFSLQYEMSYSNILNMLDLANIPIFSNKRTDEDPIIFCGGPCACNPEPLAPFVDVFVLGDGEDANNEFLDVYAEYKKAGKSRQEFLREIAQHNGFYVPQFYTPKYDENDQFLELVAEDGMPKTIVRQIIKDLDGAYFPTDIIVPYLPAVHDRIMLEIFRGCTRGCRFCQAGFLYRPIRERSVETLLRQARELIRNTGYEEISLVSLSSGDYPCIGELIEQLLEEGEKQKVSIALPSLRVDSFDKDYAEKMQGVRKSSLTFAPEAGTQRLRDVINKGVTEEDLIRTVSGAFESGWNAVKLYFMIGLPTETDEDLDGIVQLARAVSNAYYAIPKEKRQKGFRVTISASTFVPKPFTPFQWQAQNTKEEIVRKQQYLKEKLKAVKGVEFQYHTSDVSLLEDAFARGDRKIADVLYHAWKNGAKFDAWTEGFSFDIWKNAFDACGIDMNEYKARIYDVNMPLPYDHIDMHVTKDYLQKEWMRAQQAGITKDCRDGCNACFDASDVQTYCAKNNQGGAI